MLTIFGRNTRFFDGNWRRKLLKVGTLGPRSVLCLLLFATCSYVEGQWPEDIDKNIKVRLVDVSFSNEKRTGSLICRFAPVKERGGREIGLGKEFTVELLPYGGSPHSATIINVISSCMSTDRRLDENGRNPLKLELTLSVPPDLGEGDGPGGFKKLHPIDFSRWWIVSVAISNPK